MPRFANACVHAICQARAGSRLSDFYIERVASRTSYLAALFPVQAPKRLWPFGQALGPSHQQTQSEQWVESLGLRLHPQSPNLSHDFAHRLMQATMDATTPPSSYAAAHKQRLTCLVRARLIRARWLPQE